MASRTGALLPYCSASLPADSGPNTSSKFLALSRLVCKAPTHPSLRENPHQGRPSARARLSGIGVILLGKPCVFAGRPRGDRKQAGHAHHHWKRFSVFFAFSFSFPLFYFFHTSANKFYSWFHFYMAPDGMNTTGIRANTCRRFNNCRYLMNL